MLSPEQLANNPRDGEETGRFRSAFQRTFGKDNDLNIDELNSQQYDSCEQESRLLRLSESKAFNQRQPIACPSTLKRQSRWGRISDEPTEDEACVDTIEGLIKEQFIVAEEEKKIRENKNLTFVDKFDAVKSVRSLSKTIEGLIGREKDKISELCRDSHRSTFERVFPEGSPSLKEQSRLGELLISQVNQQRAALLASVPALRPGEEDSIYSYRNHNTSSEQESFPNSFEDPNPLKKSQLVLKPADRNGGTPQFDKTKRGE